MAHKSHILNDCDAVGCWRGAAYRVFNNKNSAVGEYCKTHADKRVRELRRTEEAVRAARASLTAKEISRAKLPRRRAGTLK